MWDVLFAPARLLRQFPGVRVPIPLVIFLCLAVIGGFWWSGSRDKDFLTPPPETTLALIRAKAEFAMPQTDAPAAPPTRPPSRSTPPVAEQPSPIIPPVSPPSLDEYRDLASKGAAPMISTARLMEDNGNFELALLAWERVVDMSKADASQRDQALLAIQRLRATLPDWNSDPSRALEIVLHAGAGKTTAEALTPAIEETARELESASSGLLKVTAKIISGRDHAADGPAPIALWLTGSTENSPTTDVLSFTVDSKKDPHNDLHATVYRLIRGYLARTATHNTPMKLSKNGSPETALNSHITRLAWREFGTRLNQAPEPPE